MKPGLPHLHVGSPRPFLALLCTALLAVACAPLIAQTDAGSMEGAKTGQTASAQPAKPMPSPPATASVSVSGGTIDIHYNTPSMRGRTIMGDLVPYGKVWRTGANPATTIITSVPLKFGTLVVPAGTHTLFSLPSADVWQLIVNNQTGQWGLAYDQSKDLGRVPMQAKPMAAPQEVMSLSFENTTPTSTELHIRWETTDRYITIATP